MATGKSQRVFILIILVVMVVGTIGGFVAMMMATDSERQEYADRQKQIQEFQEKLKEQQEKMMAERKAKFAPIAKQHYPTMKEYASKPARFEKDGINELKKEDLKVGTGEEITDPSKYAAYYIGWNPDGVVFDQSIDKDSLKPPIQIKGVITGWTEGVKGMKVGGVRLVTIPSDQAYGEKGAGDKIPPNTPLKFIILAIEKPEGL